MERGTDDEPNNQGTRNPDSALIFEGKPLENPVLRPRKAFFRSLLEALLKEEGRSRFRTGSKIAVARTLVECVAFAHLQRHLAASPLARSLFYGDEKRATDATTPMRGKHGEIVEIE